MIIILIYNLNIVKQIKHVEVHKMKKKFFSTIIATVLLGTMLIGCGTGSNKTAESKNETVTVTDVKGNVEIPKNPKRIC